MTTLARSMVLPFGNSAAQAARSVVGRLGSRLGHARGDAELVVSELATNAIKFGAPPVRLRLELDEEVLRLEVCDAGGGTPQLVEPTPEGGFGLHLVDRLASRWGVEPGETLVWAELDVSLDRV